MDSKPKRDYKDLPSQVVPDCTPEAAMTAYFLSKYEQRLSKNKPEWDSPPFLPAIQLVASCRDLEVAKKKLRDKLYEMKERRNQMDKCWEELREKEQWLRESFVHFNKSVQENKGKREKAEKKIQEEKIVQEQREKEIVELQAKIENFLQIKRTLEVHVTKHRIYEDYMKSVLAETNEFATIIDILNRFETLTAARKKLTEQQTRDLATLENTHNSVVRLTERTSQIILGLSNRLAGLQSRYDQVKAEALHWETALSNITSTVAEVRLGIDQVKTTCWNLYQQTCHRQNRPVEVMEGNVEQQLMYIKFTIQELGKIVHIARQHTSKEEASNVATCTTNPK